MKYIFPTIINNKKVEIGTIPLSHFTNGVCDYAIKIKVPIEEKTIKLKLLRIIVASYSSGGGGAKQFFGCSLDEPCDEIITVIGWNRSKQQLQPIIIESGYITEDKNDYTKYRYTEKYSPSNDNKYTNPMTDSDFPTYIEIYCGKRLVQTIGTKGASSTTSDYIGQYVWQNESLYTKVEPKTLSEFKSYSDDTILLPFSERKPDTNNLDSDYKYFPCIFVNGKKYYYGMKEITKDIVKTIYKNITPDVIEADIDTSTNTTNSTNLPISEHLITGGQIKYASGVTTQNIIYRNSSGQTTYKTLKIEYDQSKNPEIVVISHRDKNGTLIAYGIVAYNKETGETLATAIEGQGTIQNYGNGYYGITDSNGNTTVNGNNMGSTSVSGGGGSGGGGGIQYSYMQNMGSGYHMLYGSDGKTYVYNASDGSYTPIN